MLPVISLPKYSDNRGFLSSLWNEKESKESYVEDRYSVSKKNVLRGLHGDSITTKLIVLLHGEVEFFATPYNKNNPDFGNHTFLNLSSDDPCAIEVPPGYLNGHLCLSEDCVFFYKWSHYYRGPEGQVTVRYDDTDLEIPWSISQPILSQRDSEVGNTFKHLIEDKVSLK